MLSGYWVNLGACASGGAPNPESRSMPDESRLVSRAQREQLLGHSSKAIWLTGLSGAGKTTIARALEQRLHAQGKHVYVLDGDVLRQGLNANLGFSAADRAENVRRAAQVARLLVDAGCITIVAFISPFRAGREAARALFESGEFLEVFVDAPLAVTQARDPKGLYERARLGQLRGFTGIDSPYEPPLHAELVLHTDQHPLGACVDRILNLLEAPVMP